MAIFLQLNGVRRPLLDWGITSAVLARDTFAPGTLAFTVRAPVDAPRAFAYRDPVELFEDDVRRFVGTITLVPSAGSSRTETVNYVASDPWWDLQNLVYQEARYLYSEPDNPDSELVEVFSSRAVLFNALDGSILTAGQQAVQAINYARSRGVRIQPGVIDLDLQVMWEELVDANCAEVVKKCVRWSPDASAWIDASTEPPSLHIGRRADLDAIEIDLMPEADADKVVVSLDIKPNDQAAAPGVRFFFESQTAVAAPAGPLGQGPIPGQPVGGTQTRTRYASQSAGNPDAIGAVVAVIEVSGFGTDTPEPIPPTLAADYFAAISSKNYNGTVLLRRRGAAIGVSTAKVLNLANGAPEWASMRATMQRVAEDLFTGQLTVTLGQPDFLGAQGFAEYLAYRRQTNKSNYLTAKRTGEATSVTGLYYGGVVLPPAAGDYADALTPVQPTSVRVRCRTRGGTATMGGFDEFLPGVPPRKFKQATSAGTIGYYVDGVGTYGPYDCAGVQTFDPATGTITGTLPAGIIPCSSGRNVIPGWFTPATTDSSTIYSWQDTATVRTFTPTGGGFNSCTGGPAYATAGGTLTLADEDTEEAAIQRLLDSSPSWSTWQDTTCSSRRDARSPGVFSFEYREAEIWLQAFGLEPGTPHAVKVNIGRTDLAGNPFGVTFDQQLTFAPSTDGAGAIDITFTLPLPPSGYGYSVISVDFAA